MNKQLISIKTNKTILVFVIAALAISACTNQSIASAEYAQLPAGMAFAEGKEIYFVHTEVSDPEIAETLTNMMKSPVLLVPSLAEVPQEALADVYVFENGVVGMGPLGFQPDVFNNPPGTEGYSPLRQIILVKWAESASAQELTSVTQILKSESEGKLITSRTGVVVNMPFIVWDGGKR
jgi:hypothetical protein